MLSAEVFHSGLSRPVAFSPHQNLKEFSKEKHKKLDIFQQFFFQHFKNYDKYIILSISKQESLSTAGNLTNM